MKKVESLTNDLIRYYTNRELELARILLGPQATVKDLQPVLEEFIKEFANAYKENRLTNFPFMDDLAQDLHKIKKNYELPANTQYAQHVEKYVQKIVNKFKKLDPTQRKAVAKNLQVKLSFLGDYLQSLKDRGFLDPNIAIGELIAQVARGQRISTQIQSLIATKTQIKKDIDTIVKAIEAFERGLIAGSKNDPKGQLRVEPRNIDKQLGMAFGLFNEDIIQDTLNSLAQEGMSKISKSIDKTFKTGTIDTDFDVADNKAVISVNKTGTFDIGIDVKYHIKRDSKSMRRYNRGALQGKKVKEIFDFIRPQKKVKQMMYLLVNSYFFGAEAGTD